MSIRLLIANGNDVRAQEIKGYIENAMPGVFEIKTAEDQEKCYRVAKNFLPNIVILNCHVSMGGFGLAKQLKNLRNGIRLVFISSSNDISLAQKAIECKADGYVLEPVKSVELISQIERLKDDIEKEEAYLKEQQLMRDRQAIIEQQFDTFVEDCNKLNVHSICEETLMLAASGEREQFAQYFQKKYFQNIDQKSFFYIKYMCYTIVNGLHLATQKKGVDIELLFGMQAIWDKLASFQSTEEIINWLKNFIYMVIQHIAESDKNTHQRLISAIKNMIDKDVYAIESVEHIAKELKISSSYAKNIFKKYTGITIFTYLFNKRMEVAKSLLDMPELRIYEIAEKLGYKSKAYFSSAFQKYTGMTPNEYRKRMGKGL